MSLRDQFVPDLDTIFYNDNEVAEVREFKVADGKGGLVPFKARCVFDEEATKERSIVKEYNVYVGDAQCHIGAWNFPRRPLAGEIIYSPSSKAWMIIDCTYEEGAYVLALQAYGSH